MVTVLKNPSYYNDKILLLKEAFALLFIGIRFVYNHNGYVSIPERKSISGGEIGNLFK